MFKQNQKNFHMKSYKILSREQIREADAFTIKNEPISSIDLMERASNAFTQMFTKNFSSEKKVFIFCGTGNNGGDGLAVSRLLLGMCYTVKTCIIRYSENFSEDFLINLERLKKTKNADLCEITNAILAVQPAKGDIVIDAIWGSGLTRPVDGFAADIIHSLNNCGAEIVAIDIPSGMFCDTFNPGDAIIKAKMTYTFQFPKLSFFFPENAGYTGKFEVLDIGLSPDFIEKTVSPYHLTGLACIQSKIKTRNTFAHKGQFGHALLLCGSYGKIGAAVLSSKSCLHSGVGLLTSCIPACGYEILQTAVPEAMTITDPDYEILTKFPPSDTFDAIGIGPGIGTGHRTVNALRLFLSHYKKPLVIDADAINILSANPELQQLIPQNSILTPHPGEFSRLVGKSGNHEERLARLSAFSTAHKCIVVLKGAFTAISDPDGHISFNPTGNPGMATAGSGDVLTGIITSFLAQGYVPVDAARIAVFIHGLAGDIAATKFSQPAMTAADIISMLGKAFNHLDL